MQVFSNTPEKNSSPSVDEELARAIELIKKELGGVLIGEELNDVPDPTFTEVGRETILKALGISPDNGA